MVGPTSAFWHYKTEYRWKHFKRSPLLKSGATPESNYNEDYVTYILTEQAKLNLNYGTLFDDQSKDNKHKTETRNCTSGKQT